MPFQRVPDLTDEQVEIYEFIIDTIEKHGRQPSIQEISETFGINTKAVSDRLGQLARKGIITLDAKSSERSFILHGVTFKAIFDKKLMPPAGLA